MSADLEFVVGILERECPPQVAGEDFVGPHGRVLRLWQRMHFLDREPGVNPVASCPHCEEGTPYRLGERFVCNRCHSAVDRDRLLLWRLDLAALLRWLAARWELRGGVRPVDGCLWQLGTRRSEGFACEGFYWRPGRLTGPAWQRLKAYRSTLLLYGLTPPAPDVVGDGYAVSLIDILGIGRTLTAGPWPQPPGGRGNVRFDAHSGALWAAGVLLGEVPPGSKEFFFLECLAARLDHFVPYPDIRHYVLVRAGSTDATEEGTFCQGLKSRIKKKWIPEIDHLIATTNKGDGYRLRGFLER